MGRPKIGRAALDGNVGGSTLPQSPLADLSPEERLGRGNSRRNSGQASWRYRTKAGHQMKSLVTQRMIIDNGQSPLQISWIIPTGPSTLPANPTAASNQPRSGTRATSQYRRPYSPTT